jgi:hypothetical protein
VAEEVVGITLAVAVDVGSVGIGGIGPKVVGFGEEVVGAAGIFERRERGDGDGREGNVSCCGIEDAAAIGGGDKRVAVSRRGGESA